MKNFLKKIKKGLNRVIKAIIRHKGVSLGICCGIIAIGIAIGIGISFANKKEEKPQESLTEKLEQLGNNWYENFFFQGASDKDNFLEKFKDIGVKVDLENLSRYDMKNSEETTEQIIEKFKEKECDLKATKIIIYPQEPYGIKDYKMETILECKSKDK